MCFDDILDVSSAGSAGSSHFYSDVNDDVGLHIEFGRRYFFFRLRSNAATGDAAEARCNRGDVHFSC